MDVDQYSSAKRTFSEYTQDKIVSQKFKGFCSFVECVNRPLTLRFYIQQILKGISCTGEDPRN